MTTTILETLVDDRDASGGRVRLTCWNPLLDYVEVSDNGSGPVTGILSGTCASLSTDHFQFQQLCARIGSLRSVQVNVTDGDSITRFDFT